MTKLALIDGDLVAYRCAASCEPMSTKPDREPIEFAIARLDELLWKILAVTEADEYRVYLSGGENFRKLIFPEYKANRKDVRVPEYLDECRKFLVNTWNAEIVVGYEADDAIGMDHDEETIIVSIDKDFKQMAGSHYNFVKDLLEEVNEDEADYNFWRQMLIGDKADNIKGVDGIGEVKSEKILKYLSPKEREETVQDLYKDPARFDLNRKLLRILRSGKEYNNIIGEIHESRFKEAEGEKTATSDARQDSPDVSETGT